MLAGLLLCGFAAGMASNVALSPATTAPNTFRLAVQGGLNSLDPYTLNESATLGLLANVMEGLIKRDKDLKIIPGLAERWEVLEPTRWRFYLRQGVTFHDGCHSRRTTWSSPPSARGPRDHSSRPGFLPMPRSKR
jgi:peptide/nickel transport system substrate-binding protein